MNSDVLLATLKRLVEWYGRRGYESPEQPDSLLPIDEQEPEIADAMRVIAEAEARK